MNKAKAYKELQRRQTKRLSELLMTLYAAERAAAASTAVGRRLEAADCVSVATATAPPVLFVIDGGGCERGGRSRLTGVSDTAAAFMSYVATQFPRIDGGGGGCQASQPPPPPPWAPTPGDFRPATAAVRRSTASTDQSCSAAAVASEAAAAAPGSGLQLRRAARSAGGWRQHCSSGCDSAAATRAADEEQRRRMWLHASALRTALASHRRVGGSASDSARTTTSCGSSSGSSDPGPTAGDDLSSLERRAAADAAERTVAAAPIFPSASQMRQLLSSLASTAAEQRIGSRDAGRRPIRPQRSAAGRHLGRRPTDSGISITLAPSAIAATHATNNASDCYSAAATERDATATLGEAALVAPTSLNRSSRRNGSGVAKQVSFVEPQLTQVQYVNSTLPPSPPSSPPPPWWSGGGEVAATHHATSASVAIAAANSPSAPVLSEKNLQLHAAAMAAVNGGEAIAGASATADSIAAASTARRQRDLAVGGCGSVQPSRSLDQRTAAWIRERQMVRHATGASVAFSDIAEESDSERADLAS